MRSFFQRFLVGLVCLIIIGLAALFGWPEQSYERFEPSSSYLSQVDQYVVPPLPENWSQSLFETSDGTTLRWGETGNRDVATKSILIIPGYTATVSMYGEQISMLQDRGYHVMAIDMRGQGLSQRHRSDHPEKLWVSDFKVYSDDLEEFLNSHAPSDRPFILVGNSFGGHVAFRHAIDHPGRVDGLFLIAPAIQPKTGDMDYETVYRIANWARILGKGERYMIGGDNWQPAHSNLNAARIEFCASNPERLHARDVVFTRDPAQRVGDPTNQWVAEFYESEQYVTGEARISAIETPTLMIMADLEDFVENSAISETCDQMLTCRTLQIPNTGHCLFQESDAVLNTIFDTLDEFATELGAVDPVSENPEISTLGDDPLNLEE